MIESYAKRFGYGVVRDYTGHGIGTTFHYGLVVLHYDEPGIDTVIEKGMTFTIEPMITSARSTRTSGTTTGPSPPRDKSWTAQFEHTLVVTDTGAEVLTLAENFLPEQSQSARHAAKKGTFTGAALARTARERK